MTASGETRRLRRLIVLNVAATMLHYFDNVLFFARYPEPPWATAPLVDGFWFFMTPFAIAGYWLFARGHVHAGSVLLSAYAGMSLLVLGHYRYAPMRSLSIRINAFILVEACAALALLAWIAAAEVRRQRAGDGAGSAAQPPPSAR